jgi:DNA (cytosine-5)-methyltransferase 1
MGLHDSYKLPERYNDAYMLAGDGLIVPAVAHISRHIIEPICMPANGHSQQAA